MAAAALRFEFELRGTSVVFAPSGGSMRSRSLPAAEGSIVAGQLDVGACWLCTDGADKAAANIASTMHHHRTCLEHACIVRPTSE
jgi:hypothetical protein